MRVQRTAAILKNLREQPLWKLLAATKAPSQIALLHGLLLENEKVLPSSVLHERLTAGLEQLRDTGEDLPQTAAAYANDWLAQGWLVRRLAPGAAQEEYELTTEAASAIRFAMSTAQPRRLATESRLATVISRISDLAEETNTDPVARRDALLAERARIDRDLEAVANGTFKTLEPQRAVERLREVIMLAEDLTSDFHQVRDEFEQLNRNVRESLLQNEGSRGLVLQNLFEGADVIAESDAGKTFYAFWNLLLDPEQSSVLADAVDEVVSRPFVQQLHPTERQFLRGLTSLLLREGGGVHDVLQTFARSLKSFVQSREYLEHRHIMNRLKDAQRSALAVKEKARPTTAIGYNLSLTGTVIRSISQWHLQDPLQNQSAPAMADALEADIALGDISAMLQHSGIDMAALRRNVYTLLCEQSQVTMQELLHRFPAEQGLGTLVGYVSLGTKHGHVSPEHRSTLTWVGKDGISRTANVATLYFTDDKIHEFSNTH